MVINRCGKQMKYAYSKFAHEKDKKTMPITKNPNELGTSYMWVRRGGGRNGISYYECNSCYNLHRAWLKRNKNKVAEGKEPEMWDHIIPRASADDQTQQWINDPDNETPRHFCSPIPTPDLVVIQLVRETQVGLKLGEQWSTNQAKISLNAKINQKFGNMSEAERQAVKARALGSSENLMRYMRRGRNFRFPRELQGLDDLLKDDDQLSEPIRNLLLTHRGLTSQEGHELHGEKLVVYNDEDTIIMRSPRMLKLLAKSTRWFADGSYKYSPAGVAQVYRIFGLVRNRKAYPMVEIIMLNKTEEHYEKVFRFLRDELQLCGEPIKVTSCMFDCELAAVNAFKRIFPGVRPKICSFHVKQALHRMADKLGLRLDYAYDKRVQIIIRRMGAVQLLPPNLMDKALDDMYHFIVNIADDLSRMVRQKLVGLLGYFRTYWVNKLDRNIFTIFDLPSYRTNNHAESYHGRLGRKFGRKRSPLCEWLSFHQLIQSEEEEEAVAYDLFGIEQLQLVEQQNEENSASMRAKVVNLAKFMEEYALLEKNNNDLRAYLTKYLDEMGALMGFRPPSFKEYEDLEEEVDLEGVELDEIFLGDEDLADQDLLLPSQRTEVDPEDMFPQFSQALPALSQLTPRSSADPRTRVVARRSPNISSTIVNQTERNATAKTTLQSSATIRKPGISKRPLSVAKENEKTVASTRAKRQKKS